MRARNSNELRTNAPRMKIMPRLHARGIGSLHRMDSGCGERRAAPLAFRLKRCGRWTGVNREHRPCQQDRQRRALFDGTTGSSPQHEKDCVHPCHGGLQKGRRRLGAIERIVKAKRALSIAGRRAHGDIVRDRDDRKEQDHQQQERSKLQRARRQKLLGPGSPRAPYMPRPRRYERQSEHQPHTIEKYLHACSRL
jgi:hypothetical protein